MKINLRNQKRGVAVIFFAMIFGVLLAFSVIVVNTGMLVYQKIRLQSAVDLASYAGASVQAYFLGNEDISDLDNMGFEEQRNSLIEINRQIKDRYFQLMNNEMTFGSVIPVVPMGFTDPVACEMACRSMNFANVQEAVETYEEAFSDIQTKHEQVRTILAQMPEAARKAAEETIRLNIPELEVDDGSFSPGGNAAINRVDELIDANTHPGNAVLSFSSDQGMYLANVLGSVPHNFAYFGRCHNANEGVSAQPNYFCSVNGAGMPGQAGLALANAELAAVRNSANAGEFHSRNQAVIRDIADPERGALPLHFIQDPHMPSPFFVSAAEWFPENGSFFNLDSLGSNNKLFPEQTRLAAVSAAEAFGGTLATDEFMPFGTRLQGIRRLLLDPRVMSVRADYQGLFDYMEFIGPRDEDGEKVETADEVIRRFLH